MKRAIYYCLWCRFEFLGSQGEKPKCVKCNRKFSVFLKQKLKEEFPTLLNMKEKGDI